MIAQEARIDRWSMAVDGGALPIYMTRIDHAAFETTWFADESLACPPRVAGSVLRRQAEFFHGRLCAREALRQYGLKCGDVPVGRSREPVWPPGFIGSITHNHTLAAAVALPHGPYSGAGVDIEGVMPDEAWKGMIDIVLSDAEIAYLHQLAKAAPFGVLITLVFSAKESFYKAMFGTVNRFLDFDTIVLTRFDMAKRTMTFRIDDPQCAMLQGDDHCEISYKLIDEKTVWTAFIW